MKDEATYPLLDSQLSIWLGWNSRPDSVAWNLPSCLRLGKHIDVSLLSRAVERVFAMRDELHLRLTRGDDGMPRQYVDQNMRINVPRRQMSEAEAERYMDTEFVRPFTLYGAEPLCRFEIVETPTCDWLLFDFHHIIADGVTIARNFIGRDLPRAYSEATITHHPSPATQLPPILAQSLAEQAAFSSEAYRRSKAFMQEKFRDTAFTTLSSGSASPWGHCLTASENIPRTPVDTWCRQHEVSPHTLFIAAFSTVVAKLARQRRVAFFVLTHSRTSRRMKDAYGMFVSSLPFVVQVDNGKGTNQLLADCKREFISTYRHAVYPATHLCRDLRLTPGMTFGFQGSDIDEATYIDGERVCGRQLHRRDASNDIHCMVYVGKDGYDIRVDSSGKLHDEAFLSMFARSLGVCVGRMVSNCPQGSLSLASDEEQCELKRLGQGERMDYDRSVLWQELFHAQALRTPDAVALVCADGSLSYTELDELSSARARDIADTHHGRTPFVAVAARRETSFIVDVIAILKAGLAFVPIDPSWPENRHRQITDEISTPACHPACHYAYETSPSSLPAYMMYTSGSTGKPKGVVVSHEALLNLTHFIVQQWGITGESRIACHSALTFDACVEDIFPVLTTGGTLYIIPTDVRMNLRSMTRYFRSNRITGGCFTTRFGLMFAKYAAPDVGYLCLGGERLTEVPRLNCRIINTYGPTECTVDATYFDIDPHADYADIPIGRPLPNLSAFVVDVDGEMLPRGAVGELWLAGTQVATGYWNNQQATRQAFGSCPFTGGRMYRTGDLVKWNDDGQLVFIGREDRQLKVRGYRIEPAEVENALRRINGIDDAIVVQATDNSGQLVAYITGNNHPCDAEVRSELTRQLPCYMIPNRIVSVDRMPINDNGKVIIPHNPPPSITHRPSSITHKPTSEAEEKACRAFATVLQQPNVSIDDDFFELGGTSLTALLLIEELEKCGIQKSYQEIFTLRTPRNLAASVPTRHPTPPTHNPSPATLHPPFTTHHHKNSILITGATGLLGRHILHALCRKEEQDICCLVREKDGIPAEERLNRAYHTAFSEALPRRVHVVSGDIRHDDFLSRCPDGLSWVIHAAADVRHFADPLALKLTNVQGTRNVIRLCIEQKARLTHISTLSLSRAKPLDDSLHIPYLQTKREAEEEVINAIRQQGLQAEILRVGNLVEDNAANNRTSHTDHNAFLAMLSLLERIKACPESLTTVETDLSPVGEVARKIVEHTMHAGRMITDITPDTRTTVLKIVEQLNRQGAGIGIVSDDDFAKIIKPQRYSGYEAYMLWQLLYAKNGR